jgi:hypothetical protein
MAIIGPACAPECVGPPADACEKMALSKPGKIGWCDIFNAALVNFAIGNQPPLDQFAQPCSRLRIDLVVVCAHVAPGMVWRRPGAWGETIAEPFGSDCGPFIVRETVPWRMRA